MRYQSKRKINYDLINDLYMGWVNERDPFAQRKRKEDIKRRIPPYELLMYSIRYSSPFEAFRNIFSLADLFETLKEMQEQGEDISILTNQPLVMKGIEDIQVLNKYAKKEIPSEIRAFELKFQGSNVFEYGDVKGIGKTFPYACVNFLDIELIERMLNKPKNYKGIPIIITIDNIGQLPLEKLSDIERFFDVKGVRIAEKGREQRTHQGEQRPLNLKTYKQIMKVINDEIISKLYVNENAEELFTDYQLTMQILDKLNNIIEYDYEAMDKPRFDDDSVNASGLVCLLTGKAICKGYAEALRNILSCVNVESRVVDGEVTDGEQHSWNQVKLGNIWFNVDFTAARGKIRRGEPSGNLFMSDRVFFGEKVICTFEKGKEVNGKSIESTVEIGGHKKAFGENYQCETYITPHLTLKLLNNSRKYEEDYKKRGKSKDYKGPVPYVGSKTQKTRSSFKEVDTPTYPEY